MIREIRSGTVTGTVQVPGSKSIAQRVIAGAALSLGTTQIHGAGDSDDVRSALRLARALGAAVDVGGLISIEGRGIFPDPKVDAGESGLASRMFIPLFALSEVDVEITGMGSLVRRPFGVFGDILPEAGVQYSSENGRLPVRVKGPLKSGNYSLDGSVSSQFITGLLMALPMCDGDSNLKVHDPVSIPYIQCTLDVMARFNVFAEHHAYSEFHISGGQHYQPGEWLVPADWSSVATLLVAGVLLSEGEYNIQIPDSSITQADAHILSVLKRAGIRLNLKRDYFIVTRTEPSSFEADLSHSPDLFPILSVLAAFANGESVLHGTHRLRVKESDRCSAIISMLSNCGITAAERDNSLIISGGGPIVHGKIESHGDHRIAMAATLLGMAGSGCEIDDTACVSKSFPGFFKALGLT